MNSTPGDEVQQRDEISRHRCPPLFDRHERERRRSRLARSAGDFAIRRQLCRLFTWRSTKVSFGFSKSMSWAASVRAGPCDRILTMRSLPCFSTADFQLAGQKHPPGRDRGRCPASWTSSAALSCLPYSTSVDSPHPALDLRDLPLLVAQVIVVRDHRVRGVERPRAGPETSGKTQHQEEAPELSAS